MRLSRYRGIATRIVALGAIGFVAISAPVKAQSPFASEVISYEPGLDVGSDWLSGKPFTDPSTALGRPTVDTTGDDWAIPQTTKVPVTAIYPPFRATELVSLGTGGQIIVKFDHKVLNDPANPFGLDMIIFGNSAGYEANFTMVGDPAKLKLVNGGSSEAGRVSVSQDGTTWVTFMNGPWADSFAPTLGRMFDPAHADPALGIDNLWWGAPTDPTIPLDPALSPGSIIDKTVADVAQMYGRSAGGTGFDIGSLGLDWIQYVRVENSGAGTPDIDAFADVSAVPEPALMGLASVLSLLSLRPRRRG